MSASKLFHYFSGHPAAFGFQTSSPSDNITLLPITVFLTFRPALVQLLFSHLGHKAAYFSYTRTVLVDTIATLVGSDGG